MQLPPFKLECFFRAHEFNVDYNLCGSDCESLSVRKIVEMESGADVFLAQVVRDLVARLAKHAHIQPDDE